MKKIFSYVIYWLIQCTWGIIMTLIGAVAALGLLITKHRPTCFGPNVAFTVGNGWGGVSFGPFIICDNYSYSAIKYHEAGHGLQNAIWGPLFPFVIAIPSFVRYWLRTRPTTLTKRIYNLFLLVVTFVILTFFICLFGLVSHLPILTRVLELLRAYFCAISLWLTFFEIPKYDNGLVLYDDVWFEGQATAWGEKYYAEVQ